jgi:hypothetical protein
VKEAGIYEDSVIVIVADHGISFSYGSGPRLYNEKGADGIAYPPLLIKAPGQDEGVVDDQAIWSYDVLPTVADLLGIEVPWKTDGVPAGSPEIEARGHERTIYDFGDIDDPEPRTSATFDDTDHYPSEANRWIRSIGPDEPPLIGLVEFASCAKWLGAELDSLASPADGSASVRGLADLEDPTTSPRPGFITGTVDGHAGPGRILVAVNGVIVTASPAMEGDGGVSFRAMLPPGLSSLDDIDIRLAWIPKRIGRDPTGMVELEVEG